METQTPVRHLGCFAPNIRTLPRDVGRGGSSKEKEVDNTTDHAVFDVFTGFGESNVHSVRVEEEDSICAGILSDFLVDVDRVSSVEVGIGWYTVSIPGPQGACVIVSFDWKSEGQHTSGSSETYS